MRPLRDKGETRALILAYLRRAGDWPCTVRQVMAAAGISSTSTAHAHLQRLVEDGVVEQGRWGYRARRAA